MSEYTWMYKNARWKALRKAQLNKKPLCEECEKRGKIVIATVCDHVTAHKGNVTSFWAGPFQSLCRHHHNVKTIMEDGGLNSGAATHPAWLPKPICPVVLVTGSPGSGKTTYANKKARMLDLVIDLDECYFDVCGVHGHAADRKYMAPAMRLRNKMIASLCHKAEGKAYLIVGSPTTAETQWWMEKLDATHVRMDTPMDVCLSRVIPTRQQFVRQWHQQAKENVWKRVHTVQGADENGMPIGKEHPWNIEARQ